MNLLEINPGYYEDDELISFLKYIKKNNFNGEKDLFIKNLVKMEIKIRNLENSMENFLEKDFSCIENKDVLLSSTPGKRILSPGNVQALWAQHKYSVLARSQAFYKKIGKSLTGKKGLDGYEKLLGDLIEISLAKPEKGALFNSLLHMWGYLPKDLKEKYEKPSMDKMYYSMEIICEYAMSGDCLYLKNSTALPDFLVWADFFDNNL